ncbi:hypothetical protein AMJ51_00985 [Microgenomates bacterium DG_75]|nr:MAG: hypothetical protein AMJ51_00985 [Microgenomates bacterium DG_75]
MLATTHSLTSALIVSKIPSPVISFPLILIAHYLMDAVPHWDTGSGLTHGTKTPKTAFIHTLIDLAIAGSTVLLLFQIGKSFSLELWLGVLLGISPDLAEAPATFWNYRPFPINKLEEFHNRFHQRWRFPYGLIPQVIIIALVLLIIFFT